ncbi:hypothetical protein OS175_00355 [Marinicella sp. S1101]|uniref:hypothetical protein n=1 Tax=Marinicella marina TaxID=2996016 RepID=UPI0022608DBF|nr:hypothetical protein [Marinicella marina]MCX7552313.1 hypothetical protein [Marinicella marina]MDJ1139188.1 hypothetical protein [Marinicella marina]
MSQKNLNSSPLVITTMVLLLCACGGPRINNKPAVDKSEDPLDVFADAHVIVSLDKILVRNNPTAWVKDANWDEYLLTIRAQAGSGEIVLQSVHIEDKMGEWHGHEESRKALNRSTRVLKKKYKKAGYKVKLGQGSTHASVTGVSIALGSGYLAGAVTATGSIGTLTSVGVGVAVAVPALVISGMTKLVYNTKVNNRIQARKTILPLTVSQSGSAVDLFFPAVPLPQLLVIEYTHNEQPHQITFDLNRVTTGLHIKK